MRRPLANALLVSLLLTLPVLAGEPTPEVAGPEGQKAFADLGRYYADPAKLPAVVEALNTLQKGRPAARQQAADYLLALLKQSLADEDNGRAPWKQQPTFGGGSVSEAREFRNHLAEAFGKLATGEEALDACLWLLNVERVADNQKAGMLALRRLEGPKVNAALKQLLAPLHPNADVATGVLAEVGKRGLKGLGPEVLPLCAHYRRSVREAAQQAARDLQLAPIPGYDPEKAFTPGLEKQLRDIASMVFTPIPKDAQWVELRSGPAGGSKEKSRVVTGWLLRTTDKDYAVLDWFGVEATVAREGTKLTKLALEDTAKEFQAIRAAKGDEAGRGRGILSRRGMLSAQFEPMAISQPELLVGAWAFLRGNRATAATVLFDRLDQLKDDRWLTEAARDLLGHTYHQEMLEAFCYQRDYARALIRALHLSKPVFDGFQYQERARELAAQLPKRGDDFKTFTLPAPEEWKTLQAKLARAEQIKYLAEHLRLLNCRQWSEPGDVNYGDPQTRDPLVTTDDKKAVPVINPFKELEGMKLKVADLPALVPFLADEHYMLVFSYWRSFHPGRTLHRVNWAVSTLVNNVALRDLADLDTYFRLDAAGKKAHLDKIQAWCRANSDKTRADLLLSSLRDTEDWRGFTYVAGELIADKNAKALPILIERMKDFKKAQAEIVELCYQLDTADAVKPARGWVEDKDQATKFWAALILLRHGDKAHSEGLTPLQAVLAQDDGTYFYPRAVDDLLASKNDKAIALACAILKKPQFASDVNTLEVVLRLFLAGRREALDFLLVQLDSQANAGVAEGVYEGKEVKRGISEGDRLAAQLADWRTDDWKYPSLAPGADRKVEREKLKEWLRTQLAAINAGAKPAMRTKVYPLRFPQWRIDAP